jgi:hypothetical protein
MHSLASAKQMPCVAPVTTANFLIGTKAISGA